MRALLLLLAIGCAPVLPSAADERAAIEIARIAARDVGLELPPVVAIGYSAERVTCAGHEGDFEECSYARTDRCDIFVEWPGSFAASRFAHGTAHCALVMAGMDDVEHRHFDWVRWEVALTRALREAGL